MGEDKGRKDVKPGSSVDDEFGEEVGKGVPWFDSENPLKKGMVLIGIYKGNFTYSNPAEPTKTSLAYKIADESDGKTKIVFGSGFLNKTMAEVAIGMRIRIEYLGRGKAKTKGQQAPHMWSVRPSKIQPEKHPEDAPPF